MSLDKLLRDVVREEVARALAPLTSTVSELQSQSAIVARLASALGTPLPKRGGRAARLVLLAKGKKGKKGKLIAEGPRSCALEGCGRPARSKGYCAAHYQKFRMLQKTGRLPSDWTEFAAEGSVKNITLPRGRAGAKALADAKKKSKD
jgi:hypothetical protein